MKPCAPCTDGVKLPVSVETLGLRENVEITHCVAIREDEKKCRD